MYCPRCLESNKAGAEECVHCGQPIGSARRHLFVGQQFVFVRPEGGQPVALKVGEQVQAFHETAIISRHRKAIAFGDDRPARPQPPGLIERLLPGRRQEEHPRPLLPLVDLPVLPPPSLSLAAVVSERKIYQPHDDASLLVAAPDAPGQEVDLEVQLGGHKIYEARLPLNNEGLVLHAVPDLREGEYTAAVTLPDGDRVTCTFSAAEFSLSPLIATLEEHTYAKRTLVFKLNLRVLSQPYSGPVEFGLQCQVCGGRVVATQEVEAHDGQAESEFDVSGHGGPFHVQVVTPDGNTALVAFPGTGAQERERIQVNTLGQTAQMGLLPWDEARPVRGFFLGPGEVNLTPLVLDEVLSERGQLKAYVDVSLVQLVLFDPRQGSSQVIETGDLKRGETLEFEVAAPYTLFTAAALPAREGEDPFEGWGVVVRPEAFEASLTVAEEARPGQEVDINIEIPPVAADAVPTEAFCWLLVYDARLEHESPLPKLARRIYDSIAAASRRLGSGGRPNAQEKPWGGYAPEVAPATMVMADAAPPLVAMATPRSPGPVQMFQAAAASLAGTVAAARPSGQLSDVVVEAPVMVMAPTRMEFPEVAYQEFFHMAGRAARTVRLGDQIGTWRVRAYLFRGVDALELTTDVRADKPLYAELDLPAVADEGDDLQASVTYSTQETAELVIATPFEERRLTVEGSGTEPLAVSGPGKFEVLLRGQHESDMTARFVARPGRQTVTASRLLILDRGDTAQGQRVVVFASVGQVLAETITALVDYPFG